MIGGSPTMDIAESLDWLDQRQMFAIKLGLETTRNLLDELGNPHRRFNIVHVAGTNGKGSVGATMLAILSATGIRTGFYSSPHLSHVRERFRINETYIPTEDLAALINRLVALLGDRPLPTYFECTTLLALLWFAEQGAETVILETGMGGRLDATNVVTPRVAVITDISRDHEQYLGSTLEDIAAEKAGIIKPGVPTVFSGRAAEALPVIRAHCHDRQSQLFLFGRDFSARMNDTGNLEYSDLSGTVHPDLPIALGGQHQIVNTALALAAVELLAQAHSVPHSAIRQGLAEVRWPGRMEMVSVPHQGVILRLLLDGAHNEAGVTALAHTLGNLTAHRRLFLLWGNMADKQLGQGFLDLMSLADTVLLTRTESTRFAAPESLFALLPPRLRAKARCMDDAALALETAQQLATPDDLICVAGSLYLVGRIRQLLLGELTG